MIATMPLYLVKRKEIITVLLSCIIFSSDEALTLHSFQHPPFHSLTLSMRMLRSTYIDSTIAVENSSITIVEPWFIPLDILMTTCTIFAITFSSLFTITIIVDKTCHTTATILTGNSCLAAFIWACILFAKSLITLNNDLKQIQYQDALCIYRAYLSYSASGLFHHSILLQTMYRYVIVVYPNRLIWQSRRVQLIAICLLWLFCLLFPLGFIFSSAMRDIYNSDNQICQVPLRLSFLLIYGALCVYVMPISMIMFIYLKLILYVRGMNQRITPANTLVRAKRELKMVHRIIILAAILITLGMPYIIFMIISFFSTPPKYHFRIAFLFVGVSLVSVMIALFRYTDPLKTSILRRIQRRPNTVVATI